MAPVLMVLATQDLVAFSVATVAPELEAALVLELKVVPMLALVQAVMPVQVVARRTMEVQVRVPCPRKVVVTSVLVVAILPTLVYL